MGFSPAFLCIQLGNDEGEVQKLLHPNCKCPPLRRA